MPSIDLGKLVQASISKQINESTEVIENENKDNLNFEGVTDSLGRAYRKVTGNENLSDKAAAVGNKIKDTAEELKDKAKDVAGEAKDKAVEGAQKLGKLAQDNPEAAAGIGAGAGLLGAGLAARKYLARKKK